MQFLKFLLIFPTLNLFRSSFAEKDLYDPGPQPSVKHSLVWAYEPETMPSDIVIMIDESESMKQTVMEPTFDGVRRWIKTFNVGQGRNQTSFAILPCRYSRPRPTLWLNNNKSADQIAQFVKPTVSKRYADDQHSCIKVAKYEIFRKQDGDRSFAANLLLYITSCLETINEADLTMFVHPRDKTFNSLVVCTEPKSNRGNPISSFGYNRVEYTTFDDFREKLESVSALAREIWVLNCECKYEYKCGFSSTLGQCVVQRKKCLEVTQPANHRRSVQCPPLHVYIPSGTNVQHKCKNEECPCDEDPSWIPIGNCSVQCGDGRQTFATKNLSCKKNRKELPCKMNPCTTTSKSTLSSSKQTKHIVTSSSTIEKPSSFVTTSKASSPAQNSTTANGKSSVTTMVVKNADQGATIISSSSTMAESIDPKNEPEEFYNIIEILQSTNFTNEEINDTLDDVSLAKSSDSDIFHTNIIFLTIGRLLIFVIVCFLVWIAILHPSVSCQSCKRCCRRRTGELVMKTVKDKDRRQKDENPREKSFDPKLISLTYVNDNSTVTVAANREIELICLGKSTKSVLRNPSSKRGGIGQENEFHTKTNSNGCIPLSRLPDVQKEILVSLACNEEPASANFESDAQSQIN